MIDILQFRKLMLFTQDETENSIVQNQGLTM